MLIPRASTRRLMAAVLVLALAMGLGPPASEASRDPETHHHAYVGLRDGLPNYRWKTYLTPSFGSRFSRRLLGRTWAEHGGCGRGGGELEETCVLVHPEIVSDYYECGISSVNPTPAMEAAYHRMGGK